MKNKIDISQMDEITKQIKDSGHKLIYVAGSSASGKSYFAKMLADKLRSEGKTVAEISSDDYYHNDTGIRYLLYGTFDHPDLIEYSLLDDNIEDLFNDGVVQIPQYSFKERRRVGSREIKMPLDYVIVEGLYTISRLKNEIPSIKCYVDSDTEELIFRRLVRDQQRVNEPLYMIVSMLGKVFPMWNIFGNPQKKNADLIVDNSYEILEKDGIKYELELFKGDVNSLGEESDIIFRVEYKYQDQSHDNGVIIISELYKNGSPLLDSVEISKLKSTMDGQDEQQKMITMSISQPGIITELHTLAQTAGLNCIKIEEKIETIYSIGDKKSSVIEQSGKKYIKHAL